MLRSVLRTLRPSMRLTHTFALEGEPQQPLKVKLEGGSKVEGRCVSVFKVIKTVTGINSYDFKDIFDAHRGFHKGFIGIERTIKWAFVNVWLAEIFGVEVVLIGSRVGSV